MQCRQRKIQRSEERGSKIHRSCPTSSSHPAPTLRFPSKQRPGESQNLAVLSSMVFFHGTLFLCCSLLKKSQTEHQAAVAWWNTLSRVRRVRSLLCMSNNKKNTARTSLMPGRCVLSSLLKKVPRSSFHGIRIKVSGRQNFP